MSRPASSLQPGDYLWDEATQTMSQITGLEPAGTGTRVTYRNWFGLESVQTLRTGEQLPDLPAPVHRTHAADYLAVSRATKVSAMMQRSQPDLASIADAEWITRADQVVTAYAGPYAPLRSLLDTAAGKIAAQHRQSDRTAIRRVRDAIRNTGAISPGARLTVTRTGRDTYKVVMPHRTGDDMGFTRDEIPRGAEWISRHLGWRVTATSATRGPTWTTVTLHVTDPDEPRPAADYSEDRHARNYTVYGLDQGDTVTSLSTGHTGTVTHPDCGGDIHVAVNDLPAGPGGFRETQIWDVHDIAEAQPMLRAHQERIRRCRKHEVHDVHHEIAAGTQRQDGSVILYGHCVRCNGAITCVKPFGATDSHAADWVTYGTPLPAAPDDVLATTIGQAFDLMPDGWSFRVRADQPWQLATEVEPASRENQWTSRVTTAPGTWVFIRADRVVQVLAPPVESPARMLPAVTHEAQTAMTDMTAGSYSGIQRGLYAWARIALMVQQAAERMEADLCRFRACDPGTRADITALGEAAAHLWTTITTAHANHTERHGTLHELHSSSPVPPANRDYYLR